MCLSTRPPQVSQNLISQIKSQGPVSSSPSANEGAVLTSNRGLRRRGAIIQGNTGNVATTALGLQTQATVAKKKVLGA